MKIKTALVVEDIIDERKVIVAALEEAGFEVRSCENTEEAYSIISSSDALFNLVILDLLLEGAFEPSFHLIDRLRQSYPMTKIIILSRHGTSEHTVRAIKAGAFDFVDKPTVFPFEKSDISKMLLPKIEKAFKTDDYSRLSDRKRLLRSFSEDQLIDRILIPLLKKMGYFGVQRNVFHGPGEHGKDILPFYRYGDFYERIYYAAQVKAGSVSAKSGSRSNVHKLLDQVKSALSLSFIDKYDGSRKRIDHCVVFCSGKISTDAKMILEEATEGRRRIIIVEADDLLNLLEHYDLLLYFDRISKETIREK